MAQMQIKLNYRFIFMIVSLLIVGVYGVNLTKPALAQKYQQIVVATVDGAEIQLDEILDLIEQLPPEYQNEPLTNYYDQMVDRVINVRLAAKAA